MSSQQVPEIDRMDPNTWDADYNASRKADLDAEYDFIQRLKDRNAAEYLHVNGAPQHRYRGRPLHGSKWCPQCKGTSKLSDGYACPVCEGTGFKELITSEDYA